MKTADPQFTSLQGKIDELQKTFMAQQMETDKDRKFFPDANSTLRVTYGKVKVQARETLFLITTKRIWLV